MCLRRSANKNFHLAPKSHFTRLSNVLKHLVATANLTNELMLSSIEEAHITHETKIKWTYLLINFLIAIRQLGTGIILPHAISCCQGQSGPWCYLGLLHHIMTDFQWGLNKMADILKKVFSNTFLELRSCTLIQISHKFVPEFNWQMTISQHWFRLWLGAEQAIDCLMTIFWI